MNLNPFNSPTMKTPSTGSAKQGTMTSDSYYTLKKRSSLGHVISKKAREVSYKNHAAMMVSLNNRMFDKYSSSQDYYFSRDINDILANSPTPAVIKWNDIECFIEVDEYLKRPYQ